MQLVLYALFSLLLAGGVFLGARALGGYIVNNVIYTREKIVAHEEEVYKELCAYIRRESIDDVCHDTRLQRWFDGKNDLIVFIYDYYRQGTGALSSVGSLPGGSDEDTVMYSAPGDTASTYALLQSRYADYWYYGPLEVRGASGFPKVMRVMYFPMYTAGRYVTVLSAVLAFACFALALMLLVKRKTNYIAVLSKQLNVMAAGELQTPLTVKGGDELGSLAKNMELMRLSFISRLQHEEQMNKNASRLLTDMSHDLRTPLTALMGYLDILDSGKAATPEIAKKYLSSARNRAYQIKGMTDELFEYFLVYSYEDDKIETERVDAFTLFSQLWDEASFSLESAGFTVETDAGEQSCYLEANPQLIRRVIDNIVSNIVKYAEPASPVRAEMRLEKDGYRLTVSNAVADRPAKAESSHIGLSSCEKIARLHGGTFQSEKRDADGERFACTLLLPTAEGNEERD